MRIYVLTNIGKRITLQVASDENISSLKQKIHVQIPGFPIEHMRLVCDRRRLTEGNLSDYEITEDKTIHMLALCGH